MTALAEAIVTSLGVIHKAESKEEMEIRAERTTNLIEQFVVAGAMEVAPRTDPTGGPVPQ